MKMIEDRRTAIDRHSIFIACESILGNVPRREPDPRVGGNNKSRIKLRPFVKVVLIPTFARGGIKDAFVKHLLAPPLETGTPLLVVSHRHQTDIETAGRLLQPFVFGREAMLVDQYAGGT